MGTVGVLALQGDFEAHGRVVRQLGHRPREVKAVEHFDGLDALLLPGGETTTMLKLLDAFALLDDGIQPILKGLIGLGGDLRIGDGRLGPADRGRAVAHGSGDRVGDFLGLLAHSRNSSLVTKFPGDAPQRRDYPPLVNEG